VAQQPTLLLLRKTRYVTLLEYVDGSAIYVLPHYIVGSFINSTSRSTPWPAWFLIWLIIDWNWVWHHTLI
jgi:hypothetical protein